MNLQLERIAHQCEQLGLASMANEWPAVAKQVLESEGSYADFMEKLLNTEQQARHTRTQTTLLRFASLPSIKTLEGFDYQFASGAPRA